MIICIVEIHKGFINIHTRKVNMKERITEITSASITSPGLPNSTDDIAFRYENRLNKSIIRKILSYQNGIEVTFSPEEIAYLKKSEAAETAMSEVKVITPDPTITLKKGDTEINIKNAATLVKKMEEIYPTPNKPVSEEFVEVTNDTWVKKGCKKEVVGDELPQPKSETKPQSRNAYEIRADILSQALSWIQYKKEFETLKTPPTEDEVVEVAKRFYKFVENRR